MTEYQRIMRTCERTLAFLGVEASEGQCLQSAANLHEYPEYPNKDDKWRAWCAESLHACAHALESGDRKLAFRCILQAREYMGRLGGFWPGPAMFDAAAELQADLESKF